MNLWEEIERMCGILKHRPERIDLVDVRGLLRRCQFEIDTMRTLMETATFPGDAVLRALDEMSGD